MFRLKIVVIMFAIINFISCSKNNYVSKDEVVKEGYNDIFNSIADKAKSDKTSKESNDDEVSISNSLIEFVMKSKLQKKVKKLNQKSSKEKNEKERRKNDEAGISRFSDTIPYKSANILSTEKCSLLLEKKVIVRKRLTFCLKRLKMLPLLNKVYSFKKLLELNRQCEKEHKIFIKSIRFYKSKKCYNENYKKGKFISPLNLIK